MREILERQSVNGGQRTASFPSKQPVLVSQSSSPATFCHRRANDTAPFQRKSGATLTTCALYRGGSGSEVRRATNTHANTYGGMRRRTRLNARQGPTKRSKETRSPRLDLYPRTSNTRSAYNRHPLCGYATRMPRGNRRFVPSLTLCKFSYQTKRLIVGIFFEGS